MKLTLLGMLLVAYALGATCILGLGFLVALVLGP